MDRWGLRWRGGIEAVMVVWEEEEKRGSGFCLWVDRGLTWGWTGLGFWAWVKEMDQVCVWIEFWV